MQRDDMFNWFKRKKEVDSGSVAPPKEPGEITAASSIQPSAAPKPAAAAVAAATQSAAVVTDPPKTATAASPPAGEMPQSVRPQEAAVPAGGPIRPRDLAPIIMKCAEPTPANGMKAIEWTPLRYRKAHVVGVQANGRRVLAEIDGKARAYSYTLRKDGTYRLEGAPVTTAPRLVLGMEL